LWPNTPQKCAGTRIEPPRDAEEGISLAPRQCGIGGLCGMARPVEVANHDGVEAPV
jgi:hypothetical protein